MRPWNFSIDNFLHIFVFFVIVFFFFFVFFFFLFLNIYIWYFIPPNNKKYIFLKIYLYEIYIYNLKKCPKY